MGRSPMFSLSRAAYPAQCSERHQRARAYLGAHPLPWRCGSLPFACSGCQVAGRCRCAAAAAIPRPEKQIARITTGAYDAPMPTKNPRLTMTLTPTTAAQLRRLSELTGSSQASLISELLEGQELVFAKLIHVLEAAHLAKGQMIEGLKEDMEKAQAQIEGQLGLVLDHFDDGFAPLVAEAEKIRRRAGRVAPAQAGAARPARRGRALDPHLLTGGSK